MFSADNNRRRVLASFISIVAAGIVATSTPSSCGADALLPSRAETAVRVWKVHYTSHDGERRAIYVVLPASYGPNHHPSIPLVISPHGRNAGGDENASYWGNLPAVGQFAVVNPDGMGRRLGLRSYGYAGQIDDLANMPKLVSAALPWLRIDRTRVFAVGSSMGGQEALLLVARHPNLLAGAAAMDSVTDLARRYRQLPELACGRRCIARLGGQPVGRILQDGLREEVGGTPDFDPALYAARSPMQFANRIAKAGVPLQIWWSRTDRVVFDQEHQSAALYRALRKLNPCTQVSAYTGHWRHSHEMKATQLLPIVLMRMGLLPSTSRALPPSVTYRAPVTCSTATARA